MYATDVVEQASAGHGHPMGEEIIVFPEGASRADIVAQLSKDLPTNNFGLPIFFYRSDLLPLHAPHLTQSDINGAATGLFYTEGYPTLNTGKSFWNQLPHESFEAFKLFENYLDQDEEYGIRQIDLLAAAKGLELSNIQDLYKEYYWSYRSRAFDIFQAAAEQKRRERVIQKMENKHYDKSGALLTKLWERFEDAQWIEELNAKEAIEAVETLIKLQRLSVGLTGQHASSSAGHTNAPGASAEVILRQITQGATAGQEATGDMLRNKMLSLLSDPTQGAILQEMILRVNSTGGANLA